MKRIAFFSLVMLGGAFAALGNQWAAPVSGAFNDATKWNPEAVPDTVNGQAWWYNAAQGKYTVTLPEGTWTNPVAWRVDANTDGTEITFCGSNTVWAPPTYATAIYQGEPFAFYDQYSHFFSFEMYNDTRGAPFKFTNPVFHAYNQDGVAGIIFHSGEFNFHDPSGTAHNYDWTVSHGNDAATLAGAVHRVEVRNGVTAKVANINVRSRAARTELVVDGGVLTAAANLNIPSGAGGDSRTAVDVTVTDGGIFNIARMTLGYAGKPRDIHFVVTNNARMVFSESQDYKFSGVSNGADFDFDVTDGGVVEVGHELGLGWSANAPTRVRVLNSSWLVSKETKIGNDIAGVDCVFAATNSLIDSYRGNDSAQFRVNGEMILKDCVWTNALVNAWPANTDPKITIEGGAWTSLKKFHFGGGADAGRLTVNGGQHDLRGEFYLGYNPNANVPTKSVATIRRADTVIDFNSDEMIALGWNGTADMTIEDGVLRFPGAGGLSLGHAGASSTGSVRMLKGTLDASVPNLGVCVGRNGFGTFTQEGGAITVRQMFMGQVAVSDADLTCVFTQKGGTFTALDSIGITLAYAQGRKTKLVLDGGVMSVPQIIGGTGAAVNGGTGLALLAANGGTLVARRDNATFVHALDGVELGEQGLVVDTDYDVTITAAISSKSNEKGVLVKRGRGTLTLAGTVADTVKVEVQGGKVVFGQSVTLDALTLGTENSSGAIELADGVTLAITGAVTINHNASMQEFVFEEDLNGVTHVTVDDSPAETLEIRLDEAVTSNATAAVEFRAKDTLNVSVVSGGTLNLGGKLTRGALVTKGGGHAVLQNTGNEFYGGVSVESGWLSFTDARALGLTFADAATLTLKGGTFEYAGTTASAIPSKLSMASAVTTNPIVVKTSGDMTFGPFSAAGGALIKAGPGKVTLAAKNGNTVVTSGAGIGTGPNGCPRYGFALDPNGGAPTGEYAALNVVEGELVLQGAGNVKSAGGVVAIGLNAAEGVAQPILTVDEAYLDNNQHFFVGGNIGASAFATNAMLQITNGGTVKCDTLRVGTMTSGKPSYPEVRVNGGTLDCGFRLNCADEQTWTRARYLFENGATLKIGSYNYSSWQLYWEGEAAFTFDASSYAIAGNNHYADVHVRQAGRGSMLFRNNSTFYGEKITKWSGDNYKLTFAFDNGEWIPGTGDYDFTFTGGLGIIVDCRAGGLTLNVPATKTWTVGQKISGTGGIVKKGTGTLAFTPQATIVEGARTLVADDPVSWAFADTLKVESGTLAVANDAATPSASAELAAGTVFNPGSALVFGEVSGSGTISGGGLVATTLRAAELATLTLSGVTLTSPTFKPAVDASGTLTGHFVLTNCDYDGQVIVDFGRSELDPLDAGTTYEIGTVTGTLPDLARWRVVNTGIAQGAGDFSPVGEDGKIRVTLLRRGFLMTVR